MVGINDGYYNAPFFRREKIPISAAGWLPGYLYEMQTFDEVMDAVKKQIEFFVKLHANCTNAFEYLARQLLPLPAVSCTIDGCMEKGADVMYGGARYNSTGISGVGIGNVADSLFYDKAFCALIRRNARHRSCTMR